MSKVGEVGRLPGQAGQSSQPALQVVCLCAAWCGVCRQYQAAFEALAAKHPQFQFTWVDVEDEADLVGEVEVETFPTVMLGRGEQVLFFGTLLPQIGVLERLALTFTPDQLPAASLPAEAPALWQRMAGRIGRG